MATSWDLALSAGPLHLQGQARMNFQRITRRVDTIFNIDHTSNFAYTFCHSIRRRS